jgi:hypothetical protein
MFNDPIPHLELLNLEPLNRAESVRSLWKDCTSI